MMIQRTTLIRLGVALGAGMLVLLGAAPSNAGTCTMENSGRTICAGTAGISKARPVVRHTSDANGNAVILGGRPKGCPHQFCGCEASLYVFGKIKPELNLAANWKKLFPRATPAPGMAAARSGHVMVLVSHIAGDQWLVHDGNSGGGLTRRHVRSIRGYVVVDPSAPRTRLTVQYRESNTP